MPYQSKAQVGYLHVHEPEVAARWDKKYGVSKNLPYHKKEGPIGKKLRRARDRGASSR